ncbi:MAG: FAD-binding oxidoreductase [Nitrospirae bacterium]|nr:FAD-binding oxidoreductase [Nitrospirota bacterium]
MPDLIEQLHAEVPTLEIDRSSSLLRAIENDASGLKGAPPIAAVAPTDLHELQDLVAAARRIGLPLVPVSSSGEHHRGDTLSTRPTATVSMRHFRKILRVDRRNRVALAEAAVDFPEFTRAVHAKGLRPMLPLAPRPGKSVLGAYIEREPTIYPRFQWDMADPLLCLEVVFGTGELFRTGSAAGPGTIEEQWAAGDAQKNPMGPGQSDLMRVIQGAQGTIGIATWCSAKCEPLPSRETLHAVASKTIEPLVRVAYGLLRRNHADILFLANGHTLAALLASDRDTYLRALPAAADWYLIFSVSDPPEFPEDKLRYVWREIGGLLAAHGLAETATLPAGTTDSLYRRITRPDLSQGLPYWRRAGLPLVREVAFQTTLDRAARFFPAVEAFARTRWASSDVLAYVQPQIGGRVCHVEFDFAYAPGPPEHEVEREAALLGLARELRSLGAFFSRPYGPVTPVAFEKSSTAWIVPKVKRMFDPDGILSPGCLDVPERPRKQGGAHALQ